MSPVLTQTIEQITRAQVSLTLPATAADLTEALAALHRAGVDGTEVTVTATSAASLVLAYEQTRTLEELPSLKQVTVGGAVTPTKPMVTVNAADAEPLPLAEATPADLTEKANEGEVRPFPTSMYAGRLPEVTIPNAHRLLNQPSGTYYLRLPKETSTKETQRLVARVHSAAKSFRHREQREVLVETKLHRAQSALAVTIVKADTAAA